MHAILDGTRNRVTLTPDIVKVFQNFYSKLYTASSPFDTDILDFLDTHSFTNKLSYEHSEAVGRLKNKSPGSDRFGAEFYKAFALQLSPHLSAAFNDVLLTGKVPPSWNETTVVVISKSGRDLADPKSYRPISLLNQDYKLFTGLLAARLNKIIAAYIHQDQAGFIPGRNILDNVFQTLEIIYHCRAQKEKPALLLPLDVEKAFDSVEHGYLLTLLK